MVILVVSKHLSHDGLLVFRLFLFFSRVVVFFSCVCFLCFAFFGICDYLFVFLACSPAFFLIIYIYIQGSPPGSA